MSYSSLALGSALALMLYPHTITGTLSAASDRVIRRNAALMPAYNLLLGFIALLGYVAIAAGIHTANTSSTVPLLLTTMFPSWFAGFCLAAIAIGALVPAAIMSIATANLFTRNLYGELVHGSFSSTAMTGAQEAAMAKLISLAIKLGALAFVLLVRSQFAIELQLLGGVWILQVLPAVVGGLFINFLRGPALLWGLLAGMAAGTAMVASLGLRSSIYPLHIGGHVYGVYAALPALAINLLVAGIVSPLLKDSEKGFCLHYSALDFLWRLSPLGRGRGETNEGKQDRTSRAWAPWGWAWLSRCGGQVTASMCSTCAARWRRLLPRKAAWPATARRRWPRIARS